MLNQIPGLLGRRLTRPFELVHGIKPNATTWFELFSEGYFDHATENNSKKSKFKSRHLPALSLAGVINPTQSNFTTQSPVLTIALLYSNSMKVDFLFLSFPPKFLLMADLHVVYFNTILTQAWNHFLLEHLLVS
jgi:hypothetical protein